MLQINVILRSKTIEMNEYDDPEPAFKKLITTIKAFAGIFDFEVKRIEPFWGDETEGHWHYRQTGYTFNLVKRFPSSQMYLVSAAIFCIGAQHSLKIDKEDFCIISEDDESEY